MKEQELGARKEIELMVLLILEANVRYWVAHAR